MQYIIKAVTKGGEFFLNSKSQPAASSNAGQWSIDKARNVAKAKSMASDTKECQLISEDNIIAESYVNGRLKDTLLNIQEKVKERNKEEENKETEGKKEKKMTVSQVIEKAQSHAEQDSALLSQTAEKVSQFLDLCDSVNDLLAAFSQKQSLEDGIQEDLLHMIEFSEGVNAPKGYRYYRCSRNAEREEELRRTW